MSNKIFSYDNGNDQDWKEFLDAKESGDIVEIDSSMYWHFLEVLPPVFMDGSVFGFAEGYEHVTKFWKCGDEYFCQKTNQINPYA